MLEFNFKFALKSAIGDNGLEEMEIRSMENTLSQARKNLYRSRKKGEIGFYDEITNGSMVSEVKQTADRMFSSGCDTLYVFGMGGSSLAAIFIKESMEGIFNKKFAGKGKGINIIFSENIDPAYLHNNFSGIDIKKTVFCFVSKSAGTIEVVSQFFIVKEMLEKASLNLKDHLIFITDRDSGFLRKYADENGITALDIAKNIGGRYSIVTAGTLFPAYIMGFDIDKFLHGAVSYRDQVLNNNIFENNPVYTMASVIYLFYKRKGRNIFVINSYSDYLREFSRWFRQLFAESLGKDLISPTPVTATGATDQHSQLQLYMQGPQDKLIGFFCLNDYGHELKVNSKGYDDFKYLDGKNLSTLLLNELKGVELALAINKRPSFRVTLDRLDEFTIGELAFMCMEMVPVLGLILGINPFDQPGVEKGKKFAYLLMGRQDKSLSEEAAEMERLNNVSDMRF